MSPLTRQIMMTLLDGRILWTPKPAEPCYLFEGKTVLDRIFTGVIGPEIDVPQVWRRQGSNLQRPAWKAVALSTWARGKAGLRLLRIG